MRKDIIKKIIFEFHELCYNKEVKLHSSINYLHMYIFYIYKKINKFNKLFCYIPLTFFFKGLHIA